MSINDEIVTVDTVKKFVSDNTEGVIYPFPIEGIPEGFSFFLKEDREIGGSDGLISEGKLIGFTPGYKFGRLGSVYYKPIIIHSPRSQEEVDREIAERSKEMRQLYRDNIKKL